MTEIKHKSLKETIQEANKEYPGRQDKYLMNDSLFKIVGSFKTKEGDFSERDDWRQ
jgi:hypothetical protein